MNYNTVRHIRNRANRLGLMFRYDRKMKQWTFIDIQHNALIAQMDSLEAANDYINEMEDK